MRPGPRTTALAAALLGGAALAGCGAPTGPSPAPSAAPPVSQAPPPAPTGPDPVADPGLDRRPTGPDPSVGERSDEPRRAAPPAPEAPAEPAPGAQPVASAAPTPSPTPAPSESADPPEATSALDLLVRAEDLPPIAWSGGTAVWREVAPPSAVPPAEAIAHLALARGVGGACAAAADAVDGAATEAARVALAAGAAPGGTYEVVLLRLPDAAGASAAVAALGALGEACDGASTESGALSAVDAPQGAAVALLGDDGALVVEARAAGAFLVAVLHEQAPADVVALLLAEQARRVG